MAEFRPLSKQDQTVQAVAAKGTRQVQTVLLTQADRDPVAWV